MKTWWVAVGFGGDAPSLAELPDRLTTFVDVQGLITWLTQKSGITVSKRVDFEV